MPSNPFDQFDNIDPTSSLPAGYTLDTQPSPIAATPSAPSAPQRSASFNDRRGNLPSNPFDQFDNVDPAASLPPGFQLDGVTPSAAPADAGAAPMGGAGPAPDPAASLPPGFQLDGVAPAKDASNTPPKDNSWTGAMQRVWDNPTPGGLVSIVKGIYNGAMTGAAATKTAMQTGDMSDDATPQMAQAAMDLAPVSSGSAIRPVYQLASKAAPSAADAAVQAAERIGVTIPKYMATDGSVAPALAQGAKAVPLGGEPIVNAANQTRSQLQDAINTIAPPTAPDTAGAAAKAGIINNVKVDAPADVSALYGKLEGGPSGGGSLTDPTVKVPLTNTMKKMQELQSARANANLPEWSPNMKILAQGVTDPQGMNYAGIKQLRSYLGQGSPQTLIAEGVNPQEARQLYRPLTEDLKNAVYLGGGTPALNDFTEANTLAATTAAQRKQLYNIIGAKADVAPEAVFSRLTQLAGTKSSADLALLQQAKSAMGPQAWGQVGNAIVSRLGRDAQGNFSPDRFIGPNGYASLSPSAKSILFTPQQRSSLDDLNTVSNLVNNKITKFSNPSGTAHTLEAAGLLGGLAHPVGTIATLAGARLAATVLARPAVSRAAANLGRVQLMGASTGAIMARRAALTAAIRAEFPATAGQ